MSSRSTLSSRSILRTTAPRPLPFDQEQRYRLIGALIERRRRADEGLRVLDVGGRTGVLADYLGERDELVLVDPQPSQAPRLVLGSGCALPFQDESFDVVVAADTLEHIPGEERQAFVGECLRVARGWVVLAGPYHHPRVEEAEERLAEFVRERLGRPHRYLEEHRALGLPDRGRVAAWCRAAGAHSVCSLGHGNLERWLGLMCLALLLDRDPATRGAAERLHRFYNLALLPEDNQGEVYRHVLLAVKGEEAPTELNDLLAPREVEPEAQQAVLHALEELRRFDQTRHVLHAERARLEGEIARRDQDLEGHRLALAEARGELDRHRRALGTLREDLEGHRLALAAARSENQLLHSELEQVRDDARRIQAELLRKTRLRRRFWALLGRRAG